MFIEKVCKTIKVWLGHWLDKPCAVKIFHSFEENAYFRELKMYQTPLLRHPNIVSLIAADNIGARRLCVHETTIYIQTLVSQHNSG